MRRLRATLASRIFSAQHFSGIQNAARVERAFDGAHEVKLHGRRVAFEFADLKFADAVLGTETATAVVHQIVHGALHRRLAREKLRAINAGRLIEIEVQVAIADVTVGDEPSLGDIHGAATRRRARQTAAAR